MFVETAHQKLSRHLFKSHQYYFESTAQNPIEIPKWNEHFSHDWHTNIPSDDNDFVLWFGGPDGDRKIQGTISILWEIKHKEIMRLFGGTQ